MVYFSIIIVVYFSITIYSVPGSDIDYVVNSSGSLSRQVKPVEGTLFCSPEPGFSIFAADKKELDMHMINKKGKVIYTVKRTR